MASAVCNRVLMNVSVSAFVLAFVAGPALAQEDPASGDPTSVADIIVTAQKREQSIQDVPIAVTALSAENLDAMKIEGGSELMRAIPNVSFSKNNFSMYNFSIRGVGTKAISAGSDPAVAVSFNNSPLIRNRLFEQEYLDVNRVEVLRGPQGTLYGRNATGGVVNMIPNLPGPDFEAMLKAEAGNYGAMRGQMMVNIPLTDTFWVRAGASVTKRDGFDHNTENDTWVNGRDLFSTRLTAAWEPNNRFRANLIWEHFGEDDNRARTGKQLCTPDPGPTSVGSFQLTTDEAQGRLSQGCLPGSLYSENAYGTPNGTGMAQMFAAAGIVYGYKRVGNSRVIVNAVTPNLNPYEGVVQSRDLREIATSYDPKFRAKNDVIQLNLEFNVSDSLNLFSQTVYTEDSYYSTQDYMRYVSNDIFNDSDNLVNTRNVAIPNSIVAPGGVFTDPQLGPSRRMESADISSSENNQFYQEIRLQSDYDGGFNFSLGANYLDFETEDNYYVMNNLFTMIAQYRYNTGGVLNSTVVTNNCVDGSIKECVYVDLSSIDQLAGDGHNYFRSKNVVSTKSWGVFGEAYLNLSDSMRLTAGLRYTDDTKTSTPYPSQLLLGSWDAMGHGPVTGGKTVRGYQPLPDIEQSWGAVTGRLVLDWMPSDNVMAYASYARGYKGGGANPPRADIDQTVVQYHPQAEVFDPEYLNAFELGVKTSLLDRKLRVNATAFYYDYQDYQVSQIVDRISLNENFNAESMGFELEVFYNPVPNFRIDANLGFLKTRIGDGEGSVDVMNRTLGNEDWLLVRPWVQVPSNCIAPVDIAEKILQSPYPEELKVQFLQVLCGGSSRIGSFDPNFQGGGMPLWSLFGVNYNPLTDAPNRGRGFDTDLSGNELPNSPRWTASIGAQYTWNVAGGDLTLRGDYYRQADSYFRVYNTDYDRIKGWGNLNMAITWENKNRDIMVQGYVKNLLDDNSIVDAFTNSDDSMLTTNVFTLDPRIIGFSLTKRY